MVIRSTTTTLWHFDAGSGRRPPHQGEVVVALALRRDRESVLSQVGVRRAAAHRDEVTHK